MPLTLSCPSLLLHHHPDVLEQVLNPMEAQVNVETVILTLPASMAEAVSALRENMDTLNPKVSLGRAGRVSGVGWGSRG